MTTKERILALLEENRGTPLSGEVLAEELGVSRTAVWKAIKDLQKAGHAIAAAQNRGYTLDTDSEVLSEQGVRLFLRNKSLNLVVAQELESTCTAKQMAAAGAPHGTLVVADSHMRAAGGGGAALRRRRARGSTFRWCCAVRCPCRARCLSPAPRRWRCAVPWSARAASGWTSSG